MGPQLVFVLAVCALLRTALGSVLVDRGNLRIIGGKEVSIEEAPYMAIVGGSFDDSDFINCGGSIIHERFILTADHCINDISIRNATSRMVIVGSKRLGAGILLPVEKTLCYNAVYKYAINDICLLKLRDPVSFGPKVKLVQLPDKDTELAAGTKVNVTGWGATNNNLEGHISEFSPTLRQAMVSITSRDDCLNHFPRSEANTFCAGSTGRGSCGGDSGGPLTYNNIQIGIVASGIPNECGVIPGLYVKVATYLDWINSTITNNL